MDRRVLFLGVVRLIWDFGVKLCKVRPTSAQISWESSDVLYKTPTDFYCTIRLRERQDIFQENGPRNIDTISGARNPR